MNNQFCLMSFSSEKVHPFLVNQIFLSGIKFEMYFLCAVNL